MVISILISAFLIIFLLNLIPILGPPTWTVLSFISFTYPIPSLFLFVLIALCASTLGRTVLTLSSKHLIRNRFLSKKHRKNMDYLKTHLEKRPHFASAIFFIEAFTPLPSDQLFIAYGLTGLSLRYALVPFVLARIFTYSFWVYAASEVSKSIWAQSLLHLSFLSWSFILAEVLLLFLVYYFVRTDWEHVIMRHKFRILH
jgi:hypothetical protein